ncbi:MAG TPA: glycosyltransferase [Candidatus Acidoferrales bacterium]|nr:glycosyltransferase [Candidatus Acidoferrales bacterium]
MRVLILTKNFPPKSCGVGDYAWCLAGALAAAGEFVAVLTEPSEVPRHLPVGLREHLLGGWRDFMPVLREIQAAAPDRLQLEYSGYAWGRWGVAWWLNALLFKLRREGIPVHIGLHETAIRMRQHPLQIPVALAQWVHVGLLLAVAQTVELNMTSRVATLGRVFPWWRAKLRYRPNSSNIPVEPLSLAERQALRRAHDVVDGEVVVATFGMLHTAKRYEALIGAIPLLSDKRIKLWMLGDTATAPPEYLARLKATARAGGIEERVLWPGRLETAELSRMLQAADLFVLSQPDGHLTRSGSFMAAAAHGLPVVAVRNPAGQGQTEFTHRENVWFVDRSAPAEIAAALDALLQDPYAARRMGNELRRLYESRFDWRVTLGHTGAAGTSFSAPDPLAVTTPAKGAVTAAHAGGAKQ